MSWVDEKGRLFGRLNILDLCILLLILIIILTSVKYLFLGGLHDIRAELDKKKAENELLQSLNKQNELKVYIDKDIDLLITTQFWMDKHIYPGLEEKAENKTILLIKDKQLLQNYTTSNEYLLTINLLIEKKGDAFYYQDQLVKIGKTITIYTGIIDFNGLIIDIK